MYRMESNNLMKQEEAGKREGQWVNGFVSGLRG